MRYHRVLDTDSGVFLSHVCHALLVHRLHATDYNAVITAVRYTDFCRVERRCTQV